MHFTIIIKRAAAMYIHLQAVDKCNGPNLTVQVTV